MEKFNFKNQVITEQGLNNKSLKDLKELEQICNENDNTDLTFHLDGGDATKFLFYNEDKLIGYFGMVRSYIEGEVMAWGTIHPDYRAKSIFSEFFKSVIEECKENNVDIIKIINERDATSFREFVMSEGGVDKYSTYKMNFNKEYYKEDVKKCTDILLNRATLEDLHDIIPIGMEAFGTTKEDEKSYNESNLNNSKYSNFIGKINNTPVGIISARIENGEGSIADLAVLKSYRGRGIGRAILSKTIAYLLNQGIEKFTLSVETENKKALSLY
ncbi:GNAT family N-acetyltransferase [Clostridiaceae bacterium M8S5]|nr:GNAT family N-acetyltransferase [Clostridiaceae bacterium M8S5]